MKFDGSQRRQMHQALTHAFKSFKSLRQMLSFGLNVRLEEITNNQSLPDAIFEVIEWSESEERVAELVKAASEHSKSSEWRDFVEQVWKPLEAQNRLTPPISAQPDKLTATLNADVQTPIQGSSVITIDARRKHSRGANSGKQKTRPVRAKVDSAPPSHPFPVDGYAEQILQPSEAVLPQAHHDVDTARKAIQTVIDLIQPEKDVYRDQCQVAVLKVKEASSAIQKIPVQPVHVASRYLLQTEQAYFCDEAGKVVVFFHQLSGQTSSLLLRKDIWNRLHRLMKSLQELDNLIDTSRKHDR